ncbi:TPA: hypothetical protein KW989_001121 [Escherichia coli]|nr:hypothetical protein [Escherichia coli]HBH7998748.1 hypothetical protein [Escherichia coli]HCJ8597483.1 hypothetical protein [Escherichia coli]
MNKAHFASNWRLDTLPAFNKDVNMRYRCLLPTGILLLASLLTGCEMPMCYVGVALSHVTSNDKVNEKQELPDAQVGQYYEAVVKTTISWYEAPDIRPEKPETLPEGIQMSFWAKNKEGELFPITEENAEFLKKNTDSLTEEAWVKFSGTPQKAGEYTIRTTFRTPTPMCGRASNLIWPYTLNVNGTPVTQ